MILIINESKRDALLLSETFYYMGVLSRGVTPSEVFSEKMELYKVILIINSEAMENKKDFISEIRNFSSCPIYSISNTFTQSDRYIFDASLKNEFHSSRIYDFILDNFKKKRALPPGIYKLGEIDASANLSVPLYQKDALAFTKSEAMILRILIKSYPKPINAGEILKYAFRESRLPDISNIRTHISIMNKKFQNISEKKLIDFLYNEGYKIIINKSVELSVK